MTNIKEPCVSASWFKPLLARDNLFYLILPLVIYLLIFYAYPILDMMSRSFFDPEFTLKHYVRFMKTPAYIRVTFNTFSIAFFCTIICLVLGYIISYFLTIVSPRTSQVLIILILIPLWMSILVRSYAWMVLLGKNGILNQALIKGGLIGFPLPLMHNRFGVYVGMINVLLPYMILPLYSVMKGIDKNLIKAASILGASPWRSFIKVYFPLSLTGVAGGCLLVFIIAIGFFITPALLGGPKDTMISLLIQGQVEDFVNWGFASAIASVLLAITIGFLVIYNRLLGIEKLMGR
ncbi:MAG: ABC transporter permease [Deltaproteobacteria bacterium]|nr:ABC transporter permease [Deltaproteobacteria bacterium]